MSREVSEEAAKIIKLRDEIVEANDSEDVVRRSIENKLIDKFNEAKDYNEYLQAGRLDLLDEDTVQVMFGNIEEIQAFNKLYHEEIQEMNRASMIRKQSTNINNTNKKKQQRITPTLNYDEYPQPSFSGQLSNPNSNSNNLGQGNVIYQMPPPYYVAPQPAFNLLQAPPISPELWHQMVNQQSQGSAQKVQPYDMY